MDTRGASCCFTGHRPSKLPWGYREDDLRCMDLKMDIVQALVALYARGFRHFLCGMAEGCDLYFAESVLLLREVHDDVRLEAVVPFRGQADRWTVLRPPHEASERFPETAPPSARSRLSFPHGKPAA